MNSGSDAFDIFPAAKLPENFPLAYVRPVDTDRGIVYGVFAADGTQLALFSSRDAAYYAAKQHDLEPVVVH